MQTAEPKINPQIKLKPISITSAARIFHLVDSHRDYLSEWLPWVNNSKDIHDTRNFIKNEITKSEKATGYLMEIWYKNELVGLIDLHNINMANKKAEIGYWLGEKFQGSGIMTQAVKGMLYFAFIEKHFNRITIKTSVENIKSKNIPERLNFTFEGIERQGELLNGQFKDSHIYSMLKEDWEDSNLSKVEIK